VILNESITYLFLQKIVLVHAILAAKQVLIIFLCCG